MDRGPLQRTIFLLCITIANHLKAVFLELGSVEPKGSAKRCQGFQGMKMHNGKRVYWHSLPYTESKCQAKQSGYQLA